MAPGGRSGGPVDVRGGHAVCVLGESSLRREASWETLVLALVSSSQLVSSLFESFKSFNPPREWNKVRFDQALSWEAL
jgi:hypothetical protein